VVFHGVSGTTWRGRDALRGLITTLAGAVEQTGLEIECEIAEGDTVVSVYTAHRRHVGEYYGVAASGNELSTTAVNVFRIEDGRIRELRVVMDAELVQQLTAEPPESARHPG
jgi:predicted ester cyclase